MTVMRCAAFAMVLTMLAGTVRGAVDFEKEIAPILEGRCVECHGAKSAKGKLRLDQKQFVLERAKDDAVVVPGDSEDSELIYRISLPKGDGDIMPPEGDPLSKEEIALLAKWIDEGAQWPDGVDLGAPEPEAESDLPPVPQLSAAEAWAADIAIEKIREAGALAMRIAADSPWIDVNYSLVGKNITDEHIDPLVGVSTTATWVNLANTQITDQALEKIGKLPALTRLHLENTKVTDAGLANLAGLEHLRYLNLYGTAVTDEGIKQLAGLKNLKQVYLWQTQVTDAGVAALQEAIPEVYINTGAKLVVVEAEPEPQSSAINAKCPVSGQNINAGFTFTFKEQVIGFCCGDCKAAFEKEPEKFISKVENFKDPGTLAAKPVNSKCPISGKELNPDQTVTYQEQVIGFCCGNCKAEFEKDPAKFIAKVDGFTPRPAPAPEGDPVAGKPINTICPLSGKEVDVNHTSAYKGQTIGFCCPICKQVFEQDPSKHIGKVKEFKDPDALKPVNAKCPTSGKDISAEFVTVFEGLPIGFCCGNCKAAFEKKISELRGGGEAKPQPVSAEPVNDVCPISGRPVDKAFTFAHEGKTVAFCCEKCCNKFAEAPGEFAEKVVQKN